MIITPKILSEEIDNKYKIFNNSLIFTPKIDIKDRIDIEVGDTKQLDFLPQVKMMRWDNESNLSIRFINNDIENIITEGYKIKYITDTKEVHFYDFDYIPESGYEIEVILKSPPLTNKLEFSIQSKNIYFVHQPELTQEEKDKGSFRPENVINSYAVFIGNFRNYKDGKSYKSGKFCHIYRPKIIDSSGKSTWGILDIKDNILSITIDQSFLDIANYPIFVDPTLGYTTIGASTETGWANFIMWSEIGPAIENGTLTDMQTYTGNANTGNEYKYAIYNANAAHNGPTSSVFVNNSGTIFLSGSVWQINTLISGSIISGLRYFLGFRGNQGSLIQYYDADDAFHGLYESFTYTNDWAEPSTFTTISSRKWSAYVTYSTGGGATTYDKNYVFDTLFKKQDIDNNYIISTLIKQQNLSTTELVDILIKKLNTDENIILSSIFKALNVTETITLDTLIESLNIDKNIVMNMLIKKLNNNKNYSVDTLLKDLNIDKNYSLDNIFKKLNIDKTFVLDIVFSTITDKNYAIDTLLKKNNIDSNYFLDFILSGGTTKQYSIDILLKSFNINKSIFIDILLKKLNIDSDYIFDTVIEKAFDKNFNFDILLKELSINISQFLDILIKSNNIDKTQLLDILIIKNNINNSISIDSIIKSLNIDKNIVLDTILIFVSDKNIVLDAVLKISINENYIIDSNILKNNIDYNFYYDLRIAPGITLSNYIIDCIISKITTFKPKIKSQHDPVKAQGRK